MLELTEQQWQEVLDNETVLATGEMVDRIMAEDDANDTTLERYQTITWKDREQKWL